MNVKVGLIDITSKRNNATNAAGAWMVPSIYEPSSQYQQFLHRAFQYSRDFYSNIVKQYNVPHSQSCLFTRPSKFDKSSWESLKWRSPYDITFFSNVNSNVIYRSDEAFHFPNPQYLCNAIINDDNIVNMEQKLQSLEFTPLGWKIDDNTIAKNLILATGPSLELLQEEYIHLSGRKFYGEVFEVESSIDNNTSIHESTFFISKPLPETSTSIIGSTTVPRINYLDDAKEELLGSVIQDFNSPHINILNRRFGTRLYIKDKFPIIGKVIDSKKSLALRPHFIHGVKDQNSLVYMPNLYIFNGFGGKGFTTAPYLAQILAQYMVGGQLDTNQSIDLQLCNIERSFYKWARLQTLTDSNLRG